MLLKIPHGTQGNVLLCSVAYYKEDGKYADKKPVKEVQRARLKDCAATMADAFAHTEKSENTCVSFLSLLSQTTTDLVI